MGITCRLIGGSDSTIDGLLREPDCFDHWEYPDGVSGYTIQPGIFARLLGAKPEWKQFHRTDIPFSASREEDRLSLDKMWHGLHYLLASRADDPGDARGFLLYGGREIRRDDYPIRAFFHREVLKIARFTSDLTEPIARERFVWKKMMEEKVYPEIDCGDDFPEQLFRQYWESFGYLQQYLESLAKREYGLVIAYG